MARLSRLLGALGLGAAVTAALGAAVAAAEYNPVRHAPAHLAQAAGHGRVIVKFRQNASILAAARKSIAAVGAGVGTTAGPQAAGVLAGRLGVALADGRALGARTQVLTASGMSSAALVGALSAEPDVEWAVVDERRFPLAAPVDDPLYPDGASTSAAPGGPIAGQWYLRAPTPSDANGRAVVSSIDVEPAWAITHGASSIVVADVDTGITPHRDLDSKVLAGYDFIGWGVTHADFNARLGGGSPSRADALGVANDGNLDDADPTDPGDWITAAENSDKNGQFYECNDAGDTDPGKAVPENSSWHGTQTAGILAAATNNGVGVAGTAYDSPVLPVRALGKCGGFDSDIIAAAEWSAGIAVSGVPANPHPARVVNMSLGSAGACNAAYVDAFTALRNKGVVVVAAAGNDEGLAVSVPANCKPAAADADQTPIVVAVAGLRHAGTKVGFSDIGPEVTIAAPGGNCVNTLSTQPCLYPIVTTLNSGTTTPIASGGTYSDGAGHTSLGTSFATPMVAGTVALMLSAAPNLTNAQVITILKSTARPFPTVSDAVAPTAQPPVCSVPVAGGHKQDECICTTSTCGAGMLDAGQAVTAAAALSTGAAVSYTGPTAAATPATASVVAGSNVTLDGSASTAGSSGAPLAWQWSIADGSAAIRLGATTGASVVVTGVAAGTAHVTLTVTDPTSGLRSSSTTTVTVTPAPSGGGGGGAANPVWLAALALAGLLLGPRRARSRS